MPEYPVWLYSLSQIQTTPLVQALASVGIRGCSFDANEGQCPGLLCFDRVTEDVFDFLRETSQRGLQRVLALALPPCRLTREDANRILGCGTADVLCWTDLQQAAADVAARVARWHEIDDVINSPLISENLIGKSPVWISALRQIIETGKFTDAPALILGETGTGKELAARLIHALNPRSATARLITVDCTTIVPELSGSEFFSHERGAFTGAVGHRDGAFALANGGTLFLDETGELSLSLQAQLLRVTQEHVFKRVGGNTWQPTDFRLVCATNRDLAVEAQQGRFRSDLYYRISTCACNLPSLRSRKEDILLLARHFLKSVRREGTSPSSMIW